MITDDEYLERLVAGIQALTNDSAEVLWNELINGRQFDVVVRFTMASLRYLVLIEVKNRSRKASAEDLDAFSNKSRDQKANKAVFVNAAGYQSGAITVAEKHGIDLFTIGFDETKSGLSPTMSGVVLEAPNPNGEQPRFEISEPEEILQLVDVKLIYADKHVFKMPTERTQVEYYMKQTTFPDGRPLGAAMEPFGYAKIEEGQEKIDRVQVNPPQQITPPDELYFPTGVLQEIECKIILTKARALSGNVLIEPTAFRSPVIYTNVLTGEEYEYSLEQLPLGDKNVEPNSFYMQLHPLMYYHCDKVEGDLVTWSKIESFQNGRMSRATFKQKTIYAPHFIPVRDKATLKRLKIRLANYRALQSRNVVTK